MTTSTHPWLRPSSLPKLILCNHYRSEEGSSAAAARGTAIDAEVRDEFQFDDPEEVDAEEAEPFLTEAEIEAQERARAETVGVILEKPEAQVELDEEDRAAIEWTVETARLLATGHPVESREEQLRVEALGISGTADLLCSGANWSADIKSGMQRNYMEQQALYALGFMEAGFLDEWKIYLLYCDQQKIESYQFTLESAEAVVKEVLAKVKDPAPPQPNEYCGWCARRYACSARKEQLGIIPFEGLQPASMEKIDSALLRAFLIRAATVEDFKKEARRILLSRIAKGEKIGGVSLCHRQGSEKIPPNIIGRYIAQLGTEKVLAKLGSMTRAKFAEIWDAMMPDKPFPEEHVIKSPGSSYIRINQAKKLFFSDTNQPK